jgi:hypothetical protein
MRIFTRPEIGVIGESGVLVESLPVLAANLQVVPTVRHCAEDFEGLFDAKSSLNSCPS